MDSGVNTRATVSERGARSAAAERGAGSLERVRTIPGLARLRETYDAILIDLDGTLLDGAGKLTARAVKAVAALAEAGVTPIVCTGRSVPGSRRIHRELGLATPIVAYNGGWIGPADGPPIVHHPIPVEHTPHVVHTEGRACFSFRHHGERKFTGATDHAHHERVSAWYENVVRVDDHAALPTADLMRVSLFFESREHVDHAWDALPDHARTVLHRETFPLSMFPDFVDSHLVLCEVQKKGRGKAAGLDFLAAHLGVPPERTVAVGDQTNDVPMLREAGLAVAMGNSVPEALAHAHLVIGHHADDGFARWVEAGAPFPDRARRAS
jgi:5-amino-6-(5-phospho-D-ribitylamino)uracil phosphatase